MEEDLAGSDRLSASVARSARSASKMDHGNQISADSDSRLPKQHSCSPVPRRDDRSGGEGR